MHMNQMIHFPNLGIHLEKVGQKITVLGFDITYYGMIIGAAILIGIILTLWLAERSGQDTDDYLTLCIWLIIFGMLGARVYYILFSFHEFQGNLLKIFHLRSGGFAIYGALIAGIVTTAVFSWRRGMQVWRTLDTFVPALLIGQILGRIGNFFNREAFGEYTDGLFAMQLPIDAVRTADVTEKMRRNVELVSEIHMIQVQPLFLYEAVWCLLLLIVLLVGRRYWQCQGDAFLVYIIGYGVGRFVLEGMRVDQLLIPTTHLPISKITAAVSVIVAGILLCVHNVRGGQSGRGFYHLRKRKKHFELKFPKL